MQGDYQNILQGLGKSSLLRQNFQVMVTRENPLALAFHARVEGKPSILTMCFGLAANEEEDPQEGNLSPHPKGLPPKGEANAAVAASVEVACFKNCTSLISGLSVRTGGEPQKNPM